MNLLFLENVYHMQCLCFCRGFVHVNCYSFSLLSLSLLIFSFLKDLIHLVKDDKISHYKTTVFSLAF